MTYIHVMLLYSFLFCVRLNTSANKKRIIHLTPEQACEFYSEHYGKIELPKMVISLSHGPSVALVLSKLNAVNHWKGLLGPTSVVEGQTLYPTSLRARFGDAATERNALHGSSSLDDVEREIHFFFPKLLMHPIRTEKERTDYLNERLNPTLIRGLIELTKKKPGDPVVWLADWLLDNNPYKPTLHPTLQQLPT